MTSISLSTPRKVWEASESPAIESRPSVETKLHAPTVSTWACRPEDTLGLSARGLLRFAPQAAVTSAALSASVFVSLAQRSLLRQDTINLWTPNSLFSTLNSPLCSIDCCLIKLPRASSLQDNAMYPPTIVRKDRYFWPHSRPMRAGKLFVPSSSPQAPYEHSGSAHHV